MANNHTEKEVDSIPNCDLCDHEGKKDVPALFDARLYETTHWCSLCQAHFDLYGSGLGLGNGQRLRSKPQEATTDDNEHGDSRHHLDRS
jgi:hypothetical protein